MTRRILLAKRIASSQPETFEEFFEEDLAHLWRYYNPGFGTFVDTIGGKDATVLTDIPVLDYINGHTHPVFDEVANGDNSGLSTGSNVDTLNDSDSWTIFGVFKTADSLDYGGIIDKALQLYVELNSPEGTIAWSNYSGSFDGTAVINDNQWHRFIYTQNGDIVRGYIDGVLDGEQTGQDPLSTASNPIFIGQQISGNSTMNGNIAVVGIATRGVSGIEITQLDRILRDWVDPVFFRPQDASDCEAWWDVRNMAGTFVAANNDSPTAIPNQAASGSNRDLTTAFGGDAGLGVFNNNTYINFDRSIYFQGGYGIHSGDFATPITQPYRLYFVMYVYTSGGTFMDKKPGGAASLIVRTTTNGGDEVLEVNAGSDFQAYPMLVGDGDLWPMCLVVNGDSTELYINDPVTPYAKKVGYTDSGIRAIMSVLLGQDAAGADLFDGEWVATGIFKGVGNQIERTAKMLGLRKRWRLKPTLWVIGYVMGSGPDTGSTAGGETILLIGRGFKGPDVTSVTFDGIEASFTIIDDRQISVVTPPHAAGAVDVKVTSAIGSSSAQTFTYS